MPDLKPLRLTTDERNALATVLPEGEWDYDPDRFRVEVVAVVEQIVKAREAAARREALLEAERLGKVVQDAATDLLDISAYLIRASYREDAEKLEQALRSGSARGKALRDRLCAALAEPERDEEGGR